MFLRRIFSATSSRLALFGGFAALLLTLTACEKPTPLVGMVADGRYINAQASVWCFGDDVFTGPGSCAERRVRPPTLRVRAGEQVGVEVAADVARRGWLVAIATQPATQTGTAEPGADPSASPAPSGGGDTAPSADEFQRGPIQRGKRYFSFTVPSYGAATVIPVQVVALGDDDANSGIWQFTFRNPDA